MGGTPVTLSGTFANRYAIERELGRGATATVYLAHDTRSGRPVAIKVLRHELTETIGADRFLREIAVNERLRHPHIATVLDSGQYEGHPYFAMEYMDGGSLRALMQRERQLPIETAVSIAQTIAEALDYAHRQGLIHRDVKPENILFTDDQAYLADFGIARAIERAIDESTTSTGLVRGTPAYMSPEQASASSKIDGRSDQYSLACVLYEMLAGVPAFIGPTQEAIIAQRFQHAPREVRVYRSTVPVAVEAVIHKALSLTAADRYPTISEFSDALDGALRAPQIELRPSGPTGIRTTRKWAIAALGIGVLAATAALWVADPPIWAPRTEPDTTRYFVLPIEGDSSAPLSSSYDQMLQSLGRWKGIAIVDPFTSRSALGDAGVVTDKRAARVARRLGAGRYIRSRITRSENGLRLYGALFDVGGGEPLHEATVLIPANAANADSTFAALAEELLLRAQRPSGFGSMVLPAVQYYRAALDAREAFDLKRADSLLLTSLDLDRGFAQAALVLAQVRLWRKEPSSRWQSWAELADAGTALDTDMKTLASALVALSRGEARASCNTLKRLVTRSERDFSGWYTLAVCHAVDSVVLRDVASPSGWSFRSSYQEAVRAYVRAFELAPALHRSFQAGSYYELRQILYTDPGMLRSGLALAPDTGGFYAYPARHGDSLLFIPYRRELFTKGQVPTSLGNLLDAAAQQRELFARIARGWATAMPANAGPKEAVAISLEMLGDPSALDSVRAARVLARDATVSARLAATEVLLRFGLGRRDRRYVQSALTLADSLVRSLRPTDQVTARILAPITALLGRCRQAASTSVRGMNPSEASAIGVSPTSLVTADSLLVITAMGCRSPDDTSGIVWVEQEVRSAGPAPNPRTQAFREYVLLSRVLSLSTLPDSARVDRMALSSGDYLLRAQRHLMRGEDAEARAILEQKRRFRGAVGSAAITPDAVLTEARIWLSLGDTAEARNWLDPLLNRASWLQLTFDSPVAVGALLRAAGLRAELANAAGDSLTAKKWSAFPATLWTTADPDLRPFVQRMVQLTR